MMDSGYPLAGQLICQYPECGKSLSSKYNLRRHIESCHQGYRPYECHVCYKRFSSKQNKSEHIRLEHSYSCEPSANKSCNLTVKSDAINIPTLSSMLCTSDDPDIRPLSKVERIYLYSDLY